MKKDLTQRVGFLIILHSAILIHNSLAQSPDWIWAKSIGGVNGENAFSIAVDGAGNSYTIGYFSRMVDMDPGAGTFNLTSSGTFDQEIYILKLDASGNFVWAKSMGGPGNDVGYRITVDASGNIYAAGTFSSNGDFDPGTGTYNLTSAGNYDIFISKFDNNGNFVWAKSLGGTSNDNLSYIALDDFGNIYLSGSFTGTADFDPGSGTYNLTSSGNSDIFITKLDNAGNFLWANRIGGTSDDFCSSVVIDPTNNENLVIAGSFYGTLDFNPGAGVFNLSSAGSSDAYVSKFDNSGNFLWAKSIGGPGYDVVSNTIIDSYGNIFTSGGFRSTADFDPDTSVVSNLTSAGQEDVFISKLDSLGNFVWAKSFGGTGADRGWYITIDLAGNIYSTGTFWGTIDFDPGPAGYQLASLGDQDIYISKFDNSGNFEWAQIAGGILAGENPYSMAFDALGAVYVTGNYGASISFGSTLLTHAGSGDAFIAKLKNSITGIANPESHDKVIIYPNPATKELRIQNEEFKIDQVNIYNLLGDIVFSEQCSLNNNQQAILDISQLSAGIYFVKVATVDNCSTQKLLINK